MKMGLSQAAITRIGKSISAIEPSFNTEAFSHEALKSLETLKLKERVSHIIQCLNQQLPPFEQLAPKLIQLPKHWDFGQQGDPLAKLAAWPIIDYVAAYGIEQPLIAFNVLEALTPLYSAEFAIRPFIQRYPALSFGQLQKWTTSPNEHLRRLASEGCRPRLPWGMQLKGLIAEPTPILDILEPLKNDDSLYVRKSVANNLNDISKDNPSIMLAQCEKWQKNSPHKHTHWIIKHACRTLIKEGNLQCLNLLGYSQAKIKNAKITSNTIATERVPLTFEASFISLKNQPLIVDYAIDFLRANGKYNTKVFKMKTLAALEGQTIKINKHYSFKAITTRKYYKGEHTIHLQINGHILASQNFILN